MHEATVDTQAFLAGHDPRWADLPQGWADGAFLGNGRLGIMVSREADRLRLHLGRSDAVARGAGAPLYRRHRLEIGDLLLDLPGLQGGCLRLDLWRAELLGELAVAGGRIALRAWVPRASDRVVVELRGAVAGAAWSFRPGDPVSSRRRHRKEAVPAEELAAPPRLDQPGLCLQPLADGWAVASAWRSATAGEALVLCAAVGYGPEAEARSEALSRLTADDLDLEREAHRLHWRAFWRRSFVSVPQPALERFYVLQLYKLGSCMREDGPVCDLMGPWYAPTGWPGIWWNLNLQLTYSPVGVANLPALGESLHRFLLAVEPALRANAGPRPGLAVGRAGAPDGISPGGRELGNLLWALHSARELADLAGDRERLKALQPLLAGAVAYLLSFAEEGADGRLHLPTDVSPEYPVEAADTNYDLALLRWGCRQLLADSLVLGVVHPDRQRWRDCLARLAPYPQGPDGLLIGAGVPLDRSHRHYSHLLMYAPLQLMDWRAEGDRALIERSLRHWLSFPDALQGYSYTGAASFAAHLGDGLGAERYLRGFVERFLLPNTLYREGGGPVIETPLAGARSLQDMLLQHWGSTVRVFPALPPDWQECCFADLCAPGGIRISARRDQGVTRWITLLAPGRCSLRIETDLPRPLYFDRCRLLGDDGRIATLGLEGGVVAVLGRYDAVLPAG